MKTEAASSYGAGAALAALVTRTEGLLASLPPSLPLLALRFALAIPFFKSGLTKWDGFLTLSQGARYLFEQEFRLHIFGSEIPYPFPLTMATAAGIGELVLPVLLILGLGTRFAALGLLLMTAIIQLTIPDGWANFHLPWAAMALALVVFGGGRIAIDPLVMQRRK
ncbi:MULTISPECIES: DoxX family protein [unclassified Rhizobium]|jgi:putative oxidoreductase|uniref:DoxX family protein n=1 Tax=unclassified Rhizobium TaxID=2613769 RepID=UPI001A97F5AD|nr:MULTISPECIES: DoxX family protein [unclassified Rhizobium]MBX5158455.1 DoxX family protein [Rhizobium sp. NZLR8]MBX5169529.1 DoxX family protein [Rhizobium sp. NZLR1b]MBX5196321.1 DoxX family protein [Rhizobium sp. NZLR10]MBX5205872.1 DoxX family protein [Rhizobium sp. NZLR1]QSZ20662.1 DoxX family protein [Rhizobium sp. NZLR1]